MKRRMSDQEISRRVHKLINMFFDGLMRLFPEQQLRMMFHEELAQITDVDGKSEEQQRAEMNVLIQKYGLYGKEKMALALFEIRRAIIGYMKEGTDTVRIKVNGQEVITWNGSRS